MKPFNSPRTTASAVLAAIVLLVVIVPASIVQSTLGAGWAAALVAFAAVLLLAMIGLLSLERRAGARIDATLRQTRAQLEQAQQDRQRIDADMQRLAQFSEQLQSCRSLDEISEVLALAMRGLLPQFDGALYLQAPARNVLRRQAAWGKPEPAIEELFGPDDCWGMRRGVLYPGDARSPACRHLADGVAAGHTMCAPLKAGEGTIGVLYFQGSVAPAAADRRLAQNIADQLALTIANQRLQELLRVQRERDPLTGLFNRRHLEATLLRECLKARRRNQTVAMLMLDLDHFRRFNDRHGHDVGDVALAQIASQVLQSIGQDDVACRYGGEEFVIVMPEADAARATEQADGIRRAVKAAHIDYHGRRLEVITVSIGIAVFPLHGAEPALCLRAADKALNLAKENGRDRVELAEPLEPAPAV